MCAEGLPGVPIMTMGYHYGYMIHWGVPIYHMFVIKGKHIYNISGTHILDSVYGRSDPASINSILGELRDASRVIYVVGWSVEEVYRRAMREYRVRNDVLIRDFCENLMTVRLNDERIYSENAVAVAEPGI
jgi:hypothetical protein